MFFAILKLVGRSVAVERPRAAIRLREVSTVMIAEGASAGALGKRCGPVLKHLPSTAGEPVNLARPVKDRVPNIGRGERWAFGIVPLSVALYALAAAPSSLSARASDRFVLKGGLLVTVWIEGDNHVTRDANFRYIVGM